MSASKGPSSFIYESEELPKFFAQSVVGPLKKMPQLFTDNDVLPAQRLVMVFGRQGVGKRTALEHLCAKHDITYASLNGRDLYNGTSEVILDEDQLSMQVLIIEQANDLVAGAYASKETREFALSLKKISRETGIFIFCLMDVVPRMLEMAERDILAMEVNRSFDATIYFAAPTRVERILIFKTLCQKLLNHVNENGGTLVDGLEEADYGFLSESAAYATPLQMQRFMQRVGLLAVQGEGARLDRNLLMRCLIMKGAASYSITQGDNARLEDQFSTAAGIAIPSNKAVEEHEKEQKQLEQQAQNYVSHFVAEDPEEEEEEEEEEQKEGEDEEEDAPREPSSKRIQEVEKEIVKVDEKKTRLEDVLNELHDEWRTRVTKTMTVKDFACALQQEGKEFWEHDGNLTYEFCSNPCIMDDFDGCTLDEFGEETRFGGSFYVTYTVDPKYMLTLCKYCLDEYIDGHSRFSEVIEGFFGNHEGTVKRVLKQKNMKTSKDAPPVKDALNEEEEEEDCEAVFCMGHEELPPNLKTQQERLGERDAWFSDMAREDHDVRVFEERAWLQRKKFDHKKPSKSAFAHPSRTFPIGVGPYMALAIEYSSQEDADKEKQRLHDQEVQELRAYYAEQIERCRTKQQLQALMGELSTRAKIEYDEELANIMLVEILGDAMYRLQETDTLVDDKEGTAKDPRTEPIVRAPEDRPRHVIRPILLAPNKESYLNNNNKKKNNKKKNNKKKNNKKNNKTNNKKTNNKEDSKKRVSFKVLMCPTPMYNTSVSASNKRCVWKPLVDTKTGAAPNGLFFCDADSRPVARFVGQHLQLCFNVGGKLRVLVYHFKVIGEPKLIYDHMINAGDPLISCTYDAVADACVLGMPSYVILVDNTKRVPFGGGGGGGGRSTAEATVALMINVAYGDDPVHQLSEEEVQEMRVQGKELDIQPTLSTVCYMYGELAIGTLRGEVLLFPFAYLMRQGAGMQAGPESTGVVYHTSSSSAPIHSIHRSGGNLYATNFMYTINMEKPSAALYARGQRVSQTGSILLNDRVIGIDSCGTLLATLNKSSVLQVQTTEKCPDPDDPTLLLDTATLNTVDYLTYKTEAPERNCSFISYPGVFLGRKALYCLYPDGRIHGVFLSK